MSPRHTRPVVVTAALLELALAVVGILLGAIAGVSPLSSLAWRPVDLLLGVLSTLPLLGLFHVAWRSSMPMLRKIRGELERLLPAMFTGTSALGLAVVCLAAGVGEEILFRGFAQAWLETLVGPRAAVMAASLLFGIAHPITAGYVLIATLMGVYLGALWRATGNLLTPIVAHALYDLVVLRLLLRRARR